MESDILGYVGGFIISITLIPQLIKTYKTKRAHDISPLFVILAFLTTLIYLSYGILINETPIIAANSVLLFQNFLLLYFKYIYRNNNMIEEDTKKKNKNNYRINYLYTLF